MIAFLRAVFQVLVKIALLGITATFFISWLRPDIGITTLGLLLWGVAGIYFFVRWRFGFWLWPFGPLIPRNSAGAWGSHMRGAKIVSAADLDKMLANEKRPADLEIGGVRIPREIETRGFLFSGAPGTGKSIAITRMLDVIDRRGDPAFIADRGGIYTARYFDPAQDVILNPLDARATAWSPLAEMRDEHDADALSRSLVPEGVGDGKEWAQYAATFVAGVLVHCLRAGSSNREMLRLVQSAEPDELRGSLAGHSAAGLLAPGAERMLGSVRGIASTACAPLSRLDPDAGADAFSIRRWVTAEGRGRLFFPYQADQLRALRGLLGTMADVFATSVLALVPSFDRRIWLVLDEFASLGKVGEMENYLTNSRKHGGCAVLGMQAIAQVRELYGRDAAQTMLSSVSTSLFLRQPDPETADWTSRALGDRQVLRTMISGGSSDTAHGGGTHENWNQQVAIERAVLPAELLRLPDAQGFLSLAGGYPHALVGLALPAHREPRAEAFVPAPPRPVTSVATPARPAVAANRPPTFEL